MAVVMLMDKFSPKFLGILLISTLILLLCAILIGILGPSARFYDIAYAYNCPENNNTWTSECKGVQLSQPNTVFNYEISNLNSLNKFWSLTVFPYPAQNVEATGVEAQLSVLTSIYYYDDDKWVPLDDGNVQTNELLLCEPNQDLCWGFVLAFEDRIRSSKYLISVTFPDIGDNVEVKQNIGDVAFEFEWNEEYFSVEEMSIRVTYLIIATCAIIAFWYQTRSIPFSLLSLEQKWISLLLIGVICLNNPFYPFEFLITGPFFPILDCFLVTIHQIILVSFWLFTMDTFRRDPNLELKFTMYDVPKVVLISVFALFNFIIFVWFRVFDLVNPIIGQVQHISGLVALFFINIFIFAAIIIWVIILAILTFTVLKKERPQQLLRYSVILVPTSIVVVSIILGLFFGTFGPIQREATGFMYFFTLYNAYAWILLIAYWPVIGTFSQSNPSEATPIKHRGDFGSPGSDNIFGEDDTL